MKRELKITARNIRTRYDSIIHYKIPEEISTTLFDMLKSSKGFTNVSSDVLDKFREIFNSINRENPTAIKTTKAYRDERRKAKESLQKKDIRTLHTLEHPIKKAKTQVKKEDVMSELFVLKPEEEKPKQIPEVVQSFEISISKIEHGSFDISIKTLENNNIKHKMNIITPKNNGKFQWIYAVVLFQTLQFISLVFGMAYFPDWSISMAGIIAYSSFWAITGLLIYSLLKFVEQSKKKP